MNNDGSTIQIAVELAAPNRQGFIQKPVVTCMVENLIRMVARTAAGE